MVFVVPNVARFALHQRLEGREVVNVLDYQIDTTGSTMSREDAVEAQAKDLIDAWVSRIMGFQADDMGFESVTWVDLNSNTGTTGLVTSSSTNTLPLYGGQTSAPLPANTAALVNKTAQSARGQRNGRMYLAGLTEIATPSDNGNRLEASNVTALNSALSNFLSDTNNTDTFGTAYVSRLVVVHVLTRGASTTPNQPGPPLTGNYSVVDALTVQELLATQRRRLRG